MKMTMKSVVLLLAITAFTACSSDSHETIPDNSIGISVKVETARRSRDQKIMEASGKISASKSANLSTRMMGHITSVSVNVGDEVMEGQILVDINTSDLQAKRAQVNAKIIQATAAFKNAEKDYNRFKNLFEQESASQKELDDMTAHYEMAKAGLEAAEQMKNEVDAQFAYAKIKAPFDGVVTNKFVESGDMTNPGMPLLSIEAPKNFEVVAMIPENEIAKIQTKSEVNVWVNSIDASLRGIVTEVSTSARNTGGQYLVTINLLEANENVRSGMFATVQFSTESKGNSKPKVMVPLASIVEKGSLRGIYTVSEQNTALLRWLRLGKVYGDKVEVLSGLSAGERFILSSDSKLSNRVKVIID